MIVKAIFAPNTQCFGRHTALGQGLLLLAMAALTLGARAETPNPNEIEQGRRIYQEGILPSGQHLKGRRPDSTEVEGSAAACTKCHRQSGMGSVEGQIHVPPISGRFLFAATEDRPLVLVDPRFPNDLLRARNPATEAEFANMLRDGIKTDGAKLHALMPRYQLSDTDIKALKAYLQQLSVELSPGVGADSLQFATIITPDIAPERRNALVKMLQAGFMQRNASQQELSGRMRTPMDLIPRKLRLWQLSVWELQGAPDTWAAQLAEKYRKEPVFAVLSGATNSSWMPVHNFCQQEKIPCLFPSIPQAAEKTAFYSLYFSRGVQLEADVLGKYLRGQGKKAPKRLIQIYRDNEMSQNAATTLSHSLKDSGITVENQLLSGSETANLTGLLKKLSPQDHVVLWLNPADLALVNKALPKKLPTTYVSSYLSENNTTVFSKALKPHVRLVYPYQIGDKRHANINKMTNWLKTWALPKVDENFQSEVFFNLLLLTELSSQMLDNLYRDYLVERTEDMMNEGGDISAYPRLSLAPGQRFASKGAYIARFAKDGKLVADSEWLVP
jgi:cytochrome c553